MITANPRNTGSGTILYVGGFELPDGNAAAERVQANARIFQKLGYRVILLGVSRNRPFDGQVHKAQSVDQTVTAYETGYPTSMKQWFRQIVTDSAVRSVIVREDISDLSAIICYNYPAVAQARIARLAHGHGAKAVADCTEWYSDLRNDSIANIVKNIDVYLRMNVFNPRMDGMITTAPLISEKYRSNGVPVVEIPTLSMQSKQVTPELRRTTDGKLKLFFAGSGFEKTLVAKSRDGLKDRLDWVIELLAEAKSKGARFHIDLYGVDRDAYLDLMPSHAPLLALLDGEVVFHGRQPRSAVLKALPEAAFSIFFRKPTRTILAGFPTKYSESISFGTPVITNAIPATDQYVIQGQTGYNVPVENRNEAVKQLVTILSMSDTEINAMKLFCGTSGMFGHEAFVEPVRTFVAKLKELR